MWSAPITPTAPGVEDRNKLRHVDSSGGVPGVQAERPGNSSGCRESCRQSGRPVSALQRRDFSKFPYDTYHSSRALPFAIDQCLTDDPSSVYTDMCVYIERVKAVRWLCICAIFKEVALLRRPTRREAVQCYVLRCIPPQLSVPAAVLSNKPYVQYE